jgi:Plant transposon protein
MTRPLPPLMTLCKRCTVVLPLMSIFFDLYDYKKGIDNNDQKTIVKRRYRGAWLLVGNGYHAWPTMVETPIKSTPNLTEISFSAWLESMRKDVECTFGILKGRFRVLKTGVRLAGTESTDNMFMTCCALHNWLLEIDGLDRKVERWCGK